MGRQQQQFQVLKGVVRRTLLRRFHLPSSYHAEAETKRAPLLFGASSRLSSAAAEKYYHATRRQSHELSSGTALGKQIISSSAQNAPPKCLPPELILHSAPRAPGDVPLAESLHRSLAASPLPENLWVASLWWARGFPGLFRRAPLPSSGGGTRGLASSAGDVQQADEVGRDGQGGDEGGSATVSGREGPEARTRRRRKRTTSALEVQLPTPDAPPEGSARSRVLMASKADVNPSESNAPPLPSDNVAVDPVRPARKRRSKETSGESILRAFSENGEGSTQPVVGEGQSLALRKPLVSLGFIGTKPLETSALGKQSGAADEPICASQAPVEDGFARDRLVGQEEMEESNQLRNGAAAPAPSIARPTDALMPSNHHEEGQKAGAEIEVLVRKNNESNLSSEDAVEGQAFDAAVSTDGAEKAATGTDGNGGDARGRYSHAVDETDAETEFSNPQALYKKLFEGKGGRGYRNQEKSKLSSIFYRFAVSGWVSDQALSLYINSKFFPTAASKFRKFFMHKSTPELRSFLVSKGATNEGVQLLFPLFAEFCINEFPNEINRYRELVNTADMTKPDAWYPFARAIKRKVVYHKGPTNSGKTYNALQRFMAAPSGIYCSPLRLLAMEVFDTVNMQGVYCNLHTGQERQSLPFANHLACTVEMCYLTQQWDVAVIDEIQMMSDEYRGWAWTRAFLGLQADEIHVCGDPSALPLIRNLCAGMGDELEEHEYARFMPLRVAEESLRGDFRNIETGDCIVAFSRRDIFDIKREVELASKHRCCVIYGALPPETRTQQAKLFNGTDNGYSVLVASDAVGMGLNLNIRRVVFFSLDKFDGDSKKPVPAAQVKQIAGRAGRRNSLYPEGVTTTFFSQDLPYLRSSMIQDFEPAKAAGLFPVFEQVELFASQLPNETFAKLLERFSETCKLDGAYFLSRYDNLKRVANMLEKVKGLSLEDRFNFCFAPVNVRDPQSMGALFRYATAFSQKIPVCVEMGVPSSSARDEFELLDLEARHQVLSMYLWLSQHFPGDLFPQKEKAGDMASQIAILLGQSLVQSSRRWSKRKLSQYPYRGRQYTNAGQANDRQMTGVEAPKWEESFVRA